MRLHSQTFVPWHHHETIVIRSWTLPTIYKVLVSHVVEPLFPKHPQILASLRYLNAIHPHVLVLIAVACRGTTLRLVIRNLSL